MKIKITNFVCAACNKLHFKTFHTDLLGYWARGTSANSSTEHLVKAYCKNKILYSIPVCTVSNKNWNTKLSYMHQYLSLKQNKNICCGKLRNICPQECRNIQLYLYHTCNMFFVSESVYFNFSIFCAIIFPFLNNHRT